MKTHEIMKKYQYEAIGGSIEAVVVSDVRTFCYRLLDRLHDIQNEVLLYSDVEEEINQVLEELT